ncbi:MULTISPECIES: aspartate-alanine antiporter [Pseudomonas]|jgi:aspartate-alanine antiporter|uniref:Aspartate-alanine antiporter n=1 Tax=Pseudomonas marincola TaxID=437900 RepID=A0A653E671_9PSED|nr:MULTISPECIES: aspartate-alanine antiporter [Pseudomonas]MBQ54315.1 aspartate-alanine antiporter [Pseudomonadaceae bacterium]HCP56726.1 aspartate-alanine antiporter [Pseudomonas sp.]NRH26369.1 aspartate-alanine antiporter [Pseudomonas sp. MS19]OEO24704.1 aspartate-alanine antiporter [Pseudomonas sp. J237]CAE6896352.1 Aspartate-alanine antiporter [Pseudomonas marincola]
MLDFLLNALRSAPETAVFLTIALGVLLGRIHIGSFHLGSVAGALLVGLLVGQIGLEVPHVLKSVFFVMFIYAVGFKSGPEFFGSLNSGTLKLVILSVVLCATALAMILLMFYVYKFDAGFTAGLGAGALTDTAIMGTASSAINQLGLDPAEVAKLNSHMAVAYAITYLFGTIGLIVFVGSVAPKLLGVDLKASARELELELGIAKDEDAITIPYTRIVVRAHQVLAGGNADGKSIADIEKLHTALSVERVVRDGKIIERDSRFVLKGGDIVGVYSLREAVSSLTEWVGPEVDHEESMSFPTRSVDIILTSAEFAGKTLHEIRSKLTAADRLGCFLNDITRQGYPLPQLPNTQIRRGDVISITGRTSSVEALAKRLGRIRESNYKSDIAVHALGMVIGSLLGMLSAHVGMIPVELGVGGGVLVTALAIGWYNSRHPEIGALPPAAQWAFSEFGLTAFGAVVGLLAGPQAITAMQEHGVSLLLSGVVVTLVPPIVALYFGRYILRLHPMILFGALAGAQTEAASMNKIIDASGSNTPVIGFTVCYAISNVLLAVCGPIIIFIAAG